MKKTVTRLKRGMAAKHYQAYKKSGLTIAEYARLNNLKPYQIYNGQRYDDAAKSKKVESKTKLKSQTAMSQFVDMVEQMAKVDASIKSEKCYLIMNLFRELNLK